jgi:hypothetical protein
MSTTPAFTMVAACISADTGAGPAMASGSHSWRGNWADLPTAPPKMRRATGTRRPEAARAVAHPVEVARS